MFIFFSWQNAEEADKVTFRGRRLLNLEKVMFSTDGEGMPPGLLLLEVSSEGVHVKGPNDGPAKLLYNIGVPVLPTCDSLSDFSSLQIHH